MLTIYINYTTDYGEAPDQVSVSIEDETALTFTDEHLPALTMDGYQFDGWMLDDCLVRVGDVSNIISIDTTFNLVAKWTKERNYCGNASGGFGFPKSFVITDDSGNELTGVVTDEVAVFTATDNDVRTGMVYASENGVSTGVKDIPAYHTKQGVKVITVNSQLVVNGLTDNNAYDYTQFQAIVCSYNTNLSNSVSAEMVSINDSVYTVQSVEVLSTITVNHENKSIDFGVTNNTDNHYIIRYFTYKEIE